MGCNFSQNDRVKSPTHRTSAQAMASDQEVVVPEEEEEEAKADAAAKKGLQRKWSLASLDSACSLLSLERCAAGHGGNSILKYVDKDAAEVPETPRFVMKVWDDNEVSVYEELKSTKDQLLAFTPSFFGEVDSDDLAPELEDRYMRLSNVLHKFNANPNVMDCKLGIRSFTEQEVHKRRLREDLYLKLVQLDPSAPTAEEREAQACTKYRWMSSNDSRTTLGSLGFRIDGIENSRGKTGKEELRKVRDVSDAARTIIQEFIPKQEADGQSFPTSDEGVDQRPEVPFQVNQGVDSQASSGYAGINLCGVTCCVAKTADVADCPRGKEPEVQQAAEPGLATAEKVLKCLTAMREAMVSSEFFRRHSFIGCSLLFVADTHGSDAGVYLIDFAHTTPLPEGVSIDHRSLWKAGNHEDGILLGMDNVIKCWEQVLAGLGGPTPAYKSRL
uniref:Kinase n=1 Tax=Alexandrium monilatum TaxID=311494 RepID=A0A6T1IN00_9DINO|mmetsp:Transcript_106644/g.318782  ORF Transcript_106644/g.318782 Transcript_106644/m.318782 type:complete len:444 (+) Transcript_106644:57-1388(+)